MQVPDEWARKTVDKGLKKDYFVILLAKCQCILIVC